MRIQILLSLHFSLTIPSQDSDVTNHVPVSFKTPSGADSSEIKLFIPTRGELSLDTADKVYDNVVNSWNSVVETHNAGLLDPKHSADMVAGGLSKGEAWHHYSAGQAGVVDSARVAHAKATGGDLVAAMHEDAVELVAILGALKASQGVDRQAIAQEQAALQEAEAAAK